MPWRPKCKTEYRDGFEECAECHIPLVAELPEESEQDAQQSAQLPEGMKKPIAVYFAKNRMEAEIVCDLLREHDIAVFDRPAVFSQLKAYACTDSRFGIEVVVDASQTARARQLIDEMNQELGGQEMDEEELARLAEEQALETPEQPIEDNVSFKMLPLIAGVIVVALVLLYFVTN